MSSNQGTLTDSTLEPQPPEANAYAFECWDAQFALSARKALGFSDLLDLDHLTQVTQAYPELFMTLEQLLRHGDNMHLHRRFYSDCNVRGTCNSAGRCRKDCVAMLHALRQ